VSAPRTPIERLVRFLASPRLAAWLIGGLIALIVLAFWVPQQAIFPAEQFHQWVETYPTWSSIALALGLERLFGSWPFFAFAGLLALNLLVCTWRRVARRLSSAKRSGRPAFTWGLAGSLVMHAGILAVMAGAFVSGQTTFSGELLLTEGQTVPDSAESYLSIRSVPAWGAAFEDFAVGLDSLEFTYTDGIVTDAVATMFVVEGEVGDLKDGRVNYPVRAGTKSFRLDEAGYSAGLRATDASGTVVFDSFVTLGRFAAEGTYDSVEVAPGLTLDVLAVPDIDAPLGEPAVDLLEPRDPGVHITPTTAAGVGEAVALRPGDTMSAAGYTVEVYDVRRWHTFEVRADGGLPVVYAGFALIVVGMAVRLADPRERK
jgi:cytochrome c biogenesis protein